MVVRDSQRVGSPWADIVQIKQSLPSSASRSPLMRHPSQALLEWANTPAALEAKAAADAKSAPPAAAPLSAQTSPLSATSSSLVGGGAGPTRPTFEYGNILPSCAGMPAAPAAGSSEAPLVEWSLNTYKSRYDNDFGADASAGVIINSVRMVVVWRLVCELLECVPHLNLCLCDALGARVALTLHTVT